jgi:hypothetical protein
MPSPLPTSRLAERPSFVQRQSLAEATVRPGGETAEHHHPRSEEIDMAAPLVLLCCCAPAYSDDDTVMTGR